MTFEQALQLAQNWPFLAFALTLWWSERAARIDAEKRERTLMRELVGVKVSEE